jgi:ferritin
MNQFENVQAAIEAALNQELKVTEQINELVALTIKENDYLTHQFLQWFVTEQLEEVTSMTDLLNVVKRAGDNLFRIEDYLDQNPHETDAEGEARAD